MQAFEAELTDLVGEIWSSMLRLTVHPDDRSIAIAGREDAVISRVSITGHWRGTVSFHCDPRLAREFAAIMFGVRPEATSGDMVEDALGELTNMISGGYKSLLEGPCTLSMPAVVHRRASPPDVEASRLGCFGFRCMDKEFLVIVDAEPGSSLRAGPSAAGDSRPVVPSDSATLSRFDPSSR